MLILLYLAFGGRDRAEDAAPRWAPGRRKPKTGRTWPHCHPQTDEKADETNVCLGSRLGVGLSPEMAASAKPGGGGGQPGGDAGDVDPKPGKLCGSSNLASRKR